MEFNPALKPANESRIKLFDNFFIRLFLLFLPFSNSLTINIGFPFKISEIIILILCLIFFFAEGVRLKITDQIKVFFIFVIFAFFSTVINLFWEYPYPLREYESRFGFKFDSILKLGYVFLSFFVFVASFNFFSSNRRDIYISYFLYGAILSSLYSWYLFAFGLIGQSFPLLPAINTPQLIDVASHVFIRSGTFTEGNHMGLFLFFAIVMAFYTKRIKMAYFFICTLLTTFSSIAFVVTLIFLTLYYSKNYLTKKGFYKVLLFVLIVIMSGLSLMSNEDFKIMVISKFTITNPDDISNVGEVSKIDRYNSAKVGMKIGMRNPILGVGLSNYALHYDEFNNDVRFQFANAKRIANNVYAEIFSEIGSIGLFLFAYLMYQIFAISKRDRSGALRYGTIGTIIYFFAFPTFTMLFLWVFFGLISSLQISYSDE